jgi:hypothetical protein
LVNVRWVVDLGVAFYGFYRAEKAAEADLLALDVGRVEQPRGRNAERLLLPMGRPCHADFLLDLGLDLVH